MKDTVITVALVTYNQAKYIEKCIESILSQKVSVPFEILIHDDMSTDGTLEILKKYAKDYPDIIRLMPEDRNRFSEGMKAIIAELMLKECHGRYVSLLEGDDCFSDDSKLEKQYRIMTENEGISMCVGKTRIMDEAGNLLDEYMPARVIDGGRIKGDRIIKDICILDTHYFHLSTMFLDLSYYRDYLDNPPSFITDSYIDDRSFMLYFASKGDIYYHPEEMSLYRSMAMGSWSAGVSASAYKHYKNDVDLRNVIRDFDEFTGERYHEDIYVYETRLNYYIALFEQDGREIFKERYKEFTKNFSIKQKIHYGICYCFPFVGKLLRKK